VELVFQQEADRQPDQAASGRPEAVPRFFLGARMAKRIEIIAAAIGVVIAVVRGYQLWASEQCRTAPQTFNGALWRLGNCPGLFNEFEKEMRDAMPKGTNR
jgi:hypothetical protein